MNATKRSRAACAWTVHTPTPRATRLVYTVQRVHTMRRQPGTWTVWFIERRRFRKVPPTNCDVATCTRRPQRAGTPVSCPPCIGPCTQHSRGPQNALTRAAAHATASACSAPRGTCKHDHAHTPRPRLRRARDAPGPTLSIPAIANNTHQHYAQYLVAPQPNLRVRCGATRDAPCDAARTRASTSCAPTHDALRLLPEAM